MCALTSACGAGDDGRRIEPVYDPSTGRLQLLKYDSDGSGVVDTWSYMDGPRVLRIEIDRNEDGRIDRWEQYAADRSLERVGGSRADNGEVDSWTYFAADSSVLRVEVSTRHDGTFDRTEFFEKGAMVRAEEDTNRDGKTDKWESYEDRRLASVAYDTTQRGSPDRRLIYAADGTTRLELLPKDDVKPAGSVAVPRARP